MRHRLKLPLLIVAIAAVTACDQATKLAARRLLGGRPPVHVLDDFFLLVHAENQGGFLSLGAGWPPPLRFLALTLTSLVVLAVAVVYLFRLKSLGRVQVAGLVLVAGGGLGNLMDRILRGGFVTDFMNLGVGRLRTGIFNVADLCIMAGVVMLLIGAGKRESGRGDGRSAGPGEAVESRDAAGGPGRGPGRGAGST